MQDPQKPQDPMVTFKNTVRKKNSKGGDWFILYMTPEEAQMMYNAIGDQLANPHGVNLNLHVNKKRQQETGREFDSSICFVKPTQERRVDGPGYPQQGGQPQAAAPGQGQGQWQPRQGGLQAPPARANAQAAYQSQQGRPVQQRPAAPPQRQQPAPQHQQGAPMNDNHGGPFAPNEDENGVPF